MLNQVLRICLGFLILVVSIPVRADDVEQTVAELRERIEALEKQQSADSKTFKLYWKEGIRFDTEDKAFQMRIGGRIQNDWAFFDQDSSLEDAVGNWDDGTEFRRARLYMQGLLYEMVELKAEYDFAGGDADFKDV
jgi:phosphate-selective porin